MNNNADIIIIGAGAAGLMAAWELARTGKSVIVLEARGRIGGRIHTIQHPGFELPIEGGAEFMHGDLPYTTQFMEQAGIKKYEVKGEIWQQKEGELEEQKDFIEDYSSLNKKFKELTADLPVREFIDNYLQEEKYESLRFTLQNYVEGYYAADATRASTFALRDELNGADEEQYRLEQGYKPLVQFLFDQCRKFRVSFHHSTIVNEINYEDKIIVRTKHKTYESRQVLVTIPIGNLQSGSIIFSPVLEPEKLNAIQKLGFGPVIKTLLNFKEAFWKNKTRAGGKDLSKMSFLFTEAMIPTWWTSYPKESTMLTGWSTGPNAEKLRGQNDESMLKIALESISGIFNIPADQLQGLLKGWQVFNWLEDPFCKGGYSYEVVNGNQLQQLIKKPVLDKLFFAGEGLYEGLEIGTVEAALHCGREVAHQMVAVFKN